ncbi:hypothetical protein BJX65DRAFT_290344 [Aspergillus insuetus]
MFKSFISWSSAMFNSLALLALPCFGEHTQAPVTACSGPASMTASSDPASMTSASDVDELTPIKSKYFQSPSYRTVAPIFYGFKAFGGVRTRGAQLESLVYSVDYGRVYGVGVMTLRLDSIPMDSIPSEESPLVRRHLKKAQSLILEKERVYLRTKYGFDVEKSFKETRFSFVDT